MKTKSERPNLREDIAEITRVIRKMSSRGREDPEQKGV